MRRVLEILLVAALGGSCPAAVVGAVAYDRAGLGHGPTPTAHLDAAPPGVDVHRPVATDALYRRAHLARPARTRTYAAPAPGRAAGALPDVPEGVPALPTLSQHVTPSCAGTGEDGNRVQVMYAREAGTPDRFAEVEALIRNEVANVDDVFAVSSAATGGGRRVRWVADASCRVIVLPVELPTGSLRSDVQATFAAVRAQGYAAADRKYLLFSEGTSLCGVGEMYRDDSPTGNDNDGWAPEGMVARVDQACWANGPGYHSTAAHELVHNLGGVQDSAPDSTLAGHCNDESDLMCYVDGGTRQTMRQVCPEGQEPLLDCQKDDYFHTAPAPGSYLALSWNTARSSFLDTVTQLEDAVAPAPAAETALSLSLTGAGPVTVTATLTSSSTHAAVAGAPVSVRVREYGAAEWATVAGVLVTDSAGQVRYQHRPSRAAYVQVAFAGSSALAPATATTGLLTVPTRLLASVAPGATTTLTGTLTDAVTGAALPVGQPVTLRVRPSGTSAWSTVTTGLRTDSAGRVTYRFATLRAAAYQLSHPATATTAGSTSGVASVRIPTRAGLAARAGRPDVLTGTLVSWRGTPLVSTRVTLQYRLYGSSSWRTVTTVATSRYGAVTVRVQPRRKVFYRLVFGGSATHLGSVSPSRYLAY